MSLTIDGGIFRRMILSAAASLQMQKQHINELNVFPVPDGDTGTNMCMTLGAAVRLLQQPKQMDWEQDFPMIIAPINRVAGRDVRALPYMHWWTFIGYYMEIGDCTFSTILDIRRKLRKHKKLEKWEREYYDENRELIDFKSAHLTDNEDEFIRQLMTGGVRDG